MRSRARARGDARPPREGVKAQAAGGGDGEARLDEELQSSSYHQPPNGAMPDFLVSFHVETKDRTNERDRNLNYVQGKLIVDLYDAETKKLVWRGIATGVVGPDAVDLRLAEEMVKRGAKLLLEQFGHDLLGF